MEDFLITPKYKVVDDNFDLSELSKYHLYLKIYKAGMSFGVYNSEESLFLYYEKYQFPLTNSVIELIGNLQNIWNTHSFLNIDSWEKVILVEASDRFTFVPSEHFDKTAIFNFLQLNCEVSPSEDEALSFEDTSANLNCCFPINQSFFNWLAGIYPSHQITYIHSTNVFVNGMLNDTAIHEHLCLNIQDNFLSIVLVKEGKLAFVNTFHFITTEDFLYYTLLVFEQLSLNLAETPVLFWGLNEESEKISNLKNYISNIKAGHRPKEIQFSPQFDELPSQNGFDLFHTPYLVGNE